MEKACGSLAPEGWRRLAGGVSHRNRPPRMLRPGRGAGTLALLWPYGRGEPPSGAPAGARSLRGGFRWLTPPANFLHPSGVTEASTPPGRERSMLFSIQALGMTEALGRSSHPGSGYTLRMLVSSSPVRRFLGWNAVAVARIELCEHAVEIMDFRLVEIIPVTADLAPADLVAVGVAGIGGAQGILL